MRLAELHPSFVEDKTNGLMLMMRCPVCGIHHVGVPVTVMADMKAFAPPGRWKVSSRDCNTLTMEPSILHAWPKETPKEERCPFHFTIDNGVITMR